MSTNNPTDDVRNNSSIELPSSFLNASQNNEINKIIKFSLLSYLEQYLMIEILIYNSQFSSYKYNFYNTLTYLFFYSFN